jgi:hypothetical protein
MSLNFSKTRCDGGTLYRHDPCPDDPYFEMEVGRCPECGGKGCAPDAGQSMDEAAADIFGLTADDLDDGEDCPNCGGEGVIYCCDDEIGCTDPESGCDLCERRCDWCRK